MSDVGSVKGQLVLDSGIHSYPRSTSLCRCSSNRRERESLGLRILSPRLFQGLTLYSYANLSDEGFQALERESKKLWEETGSHVMSMDPMVHDWIFGAVSHLPTCGRLLR